MRKGHRLSSRSIKRIGAVVSRVENDPAFLVQRSRRSRSPDLRWFNVKNDSGEDIPPYAIAALIEGSLANNEHYIPKVVKPSTTFRRLYCVIEPGGIPAGRIGMATLDNPVEIAHDPSWTPADGDGGGPKPDSWLLWKNYPAVTSVVGPSLASRKILWGSLHEITWAVGKTTGAVTGGTGTTTAYRFYTTVGGIFSGADVGITSVPNGYSKEDIDSGLFISIKPMGNVCLLEPLECNS